MAEPSVSLVPSEGVPMTYVGTLEPTHLCLAWNPRREKYCRARAGWGTSHLGAGRCRTHDGGGDLKTQHGQRRRYDLRSPRVQELLEHHEQDPDPLNILDELHLARAVLQDFLERYEENTAALLAWHRSWGPGAIPLAPDKAEALRRVLDEYQEMGEGGDGLTETQERDLEIAREAVKFLELPPAQKPRKVLDISAVHGMIAETTKIVERIEAIRAKNAITYDQLKRFLFAVERALEVRIRAAFADPAEAARLIDQLRNDFLAIRP